MKEKAIQKIIGYEEFYDLDTDPDELRNLANNKDYAAIKKELSAWLVKAEKNKNKQELNCSHLHF